MRCGRPRRNRTVAGGRAWQRRCECECGGGWTGPNPSTPLLQTTTAVPATALGGQLRAPETGFGASLPRRTHATRPPRPRIAMAPLCALQRSCLSPARYAASVAIADSRMACARAAQQTPTTNNAVVLQGHRHTRHTLATPIDSNTQQGGQRQPAAGSLELPEANVTAFVEGYLLIARAQKRHPDAVSFRDLNSKTEFYCFGRKSRLTCSSQANQRRPSLCGVLAIWHSEAQHSRPALARREQVKTSAVAATVCGADSCTQAACYECMHAFRQTCMHMVRGRRTRWWRPATPWRGRRAQELCS